MLCERSLIEARGTIFILDFLEKTLQLLFIVSFILVQHLFKCGYYFWAVFISLRTYTGVATSSIIYSPHCLLTCHFVRISSKTRKTRGVCKSTTHQWTPLLQRMLCFFVKSGNVHVFATYKLQPVRTSLSLFGA